MKLSQGRAQCQSLVLFICGLFIETTLSAAQTTQHRMVRLLMNYELVRMLQKGMWATSTYCLIDHLEEPRKITQNLNRDSRCPGRKSNQPPPEHKPEDQSLGKLSRVVSVLAVFNHRATNLSSFILPVESD
jgi:hypothetical protein